MRVKLGNHESQITKNLSQVLKENIAAIGLYEKKRSIGDLQQAPRYNKIFVCFLYF